MNPHDRPSPIHSFEPPDSVGWTPASLLLFVWLAEAAWVYLVGLLASNAGAGTGFTPAAVLFPFGTAVVVTLLLRRWMRWRRLRTKDSGLGPFVAGALAALHLLAGLLALLATAWWELYRREPLLNAAWIRATISDPRHPLDSVFATPAWLAALVIFLWWRGSQLAREEIDLPPLLSRFLAATLLLLAIATMGGQLLESTRAGWWLAGYLLFGLAALSIARLEATRRKRRGGMDIGWRWRGPAIALLLLAAGFGTAFLLFPPLAEMARWLQQLLANLILPAVLEILRWIAHLLGLDKPPQPLPASAVPNVAIPHGQESTPTLPDWLREAARRIFDLSWISLFLYAFYLSIRRWRLEGRSRGAGGATRERMPWRWKLDPLAILLQLLRWLPAQWPWLWRRLGRPAAPEEQTGTIREIYRKLLRWGEHRGYARSSWATPREYCATLSTAWPPLEAALNTITESYLRARYGALPPEKEELAATLAGWQKVTEQKGPPGRR